MTSKTINSTVLCVLVLAGCLGGIPLAYAGVVYQNYDTGETTTTIPAGYDGTSQSRWVATVSAFEATEEEIDGWIGQLESNNPDTRAAAISSLAMAGQAAIDPLITVLDHNNAFIRNGAVEVLGKIDYSRVSEVARNKAINALIAALPKDPDVDVSRVVMAGSSSKDTIGVIQALTRIGEPAVGALTKALGNKDDAISIGAAQVLSSLDYNKLSVASQSAIATAFISILNGNSNDSTLSTFAAETLGKIDYRVVPGFKQAAVNALLVGLTKSQLGEDAQVAMASALVKIGDPQGILSMLTAVNSDSSLRAPVITALTKVDYGNVSGEIKSKIIDLLIGGLADKSSRIRNLSALAAGQAGDSRALQALFNAYRQEGDTNVGRSMLSAIVTATRINPSLKNAVAQRLNLAGVQLGIWNDFGILVMNNGGAGFTDAQLTTIYNTLKLLPSALLRGTNAIVSEYSGAAGLAFPQVIVINSHPTITTSLSYVVLHENGHELDYALSFAARAPFDQLHNVSGNNPANYVSSYAMTNRLEDFAETFAAYTMDTTGIIAQANANNSTTLLDKIRFMAGLFAHQGADGQTYTHVFSANSDGTITRTEVRLGANGLPVL